MVIWIIGMSASGKTTLAKEMVSQLNDNGEKWLLMDGDRFRSILGEDLGHTVDDRRKVGERIMNFSHECSQQGINLIVSILSIFPEHQDLNRLNIDEYKEIFLDVSLEKLKERDNKNLYKNAEDGVIKNVVGIDIPFPKPKDSDIVINNNEDLDSIASVANRALKKLNLLDSRYQYTYTRMDLLSHKEKYQYTKFIGEEFLEAYKRDRKEKLNYLEDKVKVLMSSFSSDNGITKRLALFGKNPMIKSELIEDELGRFTLEEKSILEIESFLLDWIDLINDEKIIESELKNQIFSMVKKFEITKRLFQTYSFPDMKRGDDEVLNLMPYILFHTLLFKSIDKVKSKEEEMILFNCALKVGDIISSSINRITTPCEVILSRNAFEMELDYFRSIRSL